ncbi:MAG TPA: hypothetical protein VG963_28320 [Polyangiaceae bacterium]|nr:hypothetical protein [Polyangiaceae bacterium]
MAWCRATASPSTLAIEVDSLWLELRAGTSGERLFWSAREAGIGIVPGSVFSFASKLERFVRLSACSSFDIDAPVARLGWLARDQLGTMGARHGTP